MLPKTKTGLSEYRASWFDGLLWRERYWDIIAHNLDEVRTCVDAECAPEFRKEVYSGKPDSERNDSLKIAVIAAEITTPFVTHNDL